jgi:hypothetical protein
LWGVCCVQVPDGDIERREVRLAAGAGRLLQRSPDRSALNPLAIQEVPMLPAATARRNVSTAICGEPNVSLQTTAGVVPAEPVVVVRDPPVDEPGIATNRGAQVWISPARPVITVESGV